VNQPQTADTIGNKVLALDPERPLAEALHDAIDGVLTYALGWATRADQDPVKAVHEYRKSIRRARAGLKLVREFMDAKTHRAYQDRLRVAVRATSPLRDADVLPGRVAEHPPTDDTRIPLAALHAVLEHERASRPDGLAGETLADGQEVVSAISKSLEAALPHAFTWADMQAALQASHRRARDAWKLARKKGSYEEVHAFRKRVKELRYQLEMLRPHTGQTEIHTRLSDLAEQLGEVTDLGVLRHTVESHECKLEGLDVAPLQSQLSDSIKEKTSSGLDSCADLFEQQPGAFASRLLHTLTRSEA